MKPLKCCDFQPFVPNYLLGAVLAAGGELPEPGEHQYQPLGLIPGRAYRERHQQTPAELRNETFLCRFFDKATRRCSIYRLRPSECRHYYCDGTGDDAASVREFAMETELAQLFLLADGFAKASVDAQIDVLNLEGEFQACDLNEMREIYRRAWAWAGQGPIEDVRPTP